MLPQLLLMLTECLLWANNDSPVLSVLHASTPQILKWPVVGTAITQTFQMRKWRPRNPSTQRALAPSLPSTVLRHTAISLCSVKWIYGLPYLVLTKPVSRLIRPSSLQRIKQKKKKEDNKNHWPEINLIMQAQALSKKAAKKTPHSPKASPLPVIFQEKDDSHLIRSAGSQTERLESRRVSEIRICSHHHSLAAIP